MKEKFFAHRVQLNVKNSRLKCHYTAYSKLRFKKLYILQTYLTNYILKDFLAFLINTSFTKLYTEKFNKIFALPVMKVNSKHVLPEDRLT